MEFNFGKNSLSLTTIKGAHQYRKMLVKRIKEIKIELPQENQEFLGNSLNSHLSDVCYAIKRC